MKQLAKVPTSRLEALRKRYVVVKLPCDYGYSSYVKGFESEFGYCWGWDEKDALAALDVYVLDNYASPEVAAAAILD